MTKNYIFGVIIALLLFVPFCTLAQSYPQPCPDDEIITINGPAVLQGTQLYYLTSSIPNRDYQYSDLTWSVSPTSLLTIQGNNTSYTVLITASTTCITDTGAIMVSLRVRRCGHPTSVTFRKRITVKGGTPPPVVAGTYACTTCSDQSTKPLLLDSNTNNVSQWGTYRIDLTSASSSDVFLAWDKFESASSTLRMVSGTNNHSGLIDLTPGSGLAALAANVTNNCSSLRQPFRFSSLNATSYVIASPNPTSDELVLEEPTPSPPTAPPYTATLYNNQSLAVRTAKGGSGKIKIDVRTLPAGIYTLRIINNAAVNCEKIIIRH
jgi:hypothetical protein